MTDALDVGDLSLFELLDDAVVAADSDHVITYCNHAVSALYGVSVEVLLGRPLSELLRIEALELPEKEMWLRVDSCGSWRGDAVHVTGQGRRLWVDWSIKRFRQSGQDKAGVINIIRDITALKEKECEREASQQFLENIAHTTPDVLYLYDLAESRNLYASHPPSSLAGQTPLQLRAQGEKVFQKSLHPDDAAAISEHHERLSILKEGILEVVYRVRDGEGGWRWLQSRDKAFRRNADGTVRQIIGIARDITEKKRAEEELRLSEEKHRRLIENLASDYFFYAHDPQGVFTYLSPSIKGMLGYSREEFMRHYTTYLTDNPINQQVVERTEGSIRGIQQPPYLVEILDSERNPRWLEITENPIFDAEGVVVAVEGLAHDITENMRAKEELDRSRERLKLINDSTVDFIYSYDRHGRFTHANESLCRALQLEEEQILGKTHEELGFPEENCSEWGRLHRQVWATNSRVVAETTTPMPGGETRHYEVYLNPLHGVDGEIIGIGGMTRDVSDWRRSEREKVSLEERLRQAQKMESIGRLAGGIAHDFNNILTGITGYVQLLLASRSHDDETTEDLREIHQAATRAAKLTGQLLAFSRKQIVCPQVVQANEILQSSQRMLRRIIGEDVELAFNPAHDLWPIRVDPGQLDQVLMNLAVNARDAMQEGGRLTIETSNIYLDDGQASMNQVPPGQYVQLLVSDTGQGMDESTKVRIFEPFFSTKSREKGTGLGLAMVYGVAQQNGGFVAVDSALGQGTTFTIYFPAVMSEVPETSERRASIPPPGSETVLVVEDEEMVRKLTKKILEDCGYTVVARESAPAALAYLTATPDPVDLLLTDVVMPGMSGKELRDKLRTLLPELKVLFMSGYSEEIIGNHGLLEAGIDLIGKPFDGKSLARKVREVLHKE
jgi:PAS domain S-box-containing protein